MNNSFAASRPQSPGGTGQRPHRSDAIVSRVAFWPLVLLFTGVDTVLILGAMTVVLANGTTLAIFASISVAVLAAVVAHEAGRQAREAAIWSRLPVASAALLLLFIAIVLGLTYIRWNAGELTSTTIAYEGDPSRPDDGAFTHHMTALALAPMLCATGIIALLHGHSARTSIENAFARTTTERLAAEQRLALLEADVVREALAVKAHEQEIKEVRNQEQRHLDAADALGQEAKAYAHRRIYLALGTPNAAGMTDRDPDGHRHVSH